MPTVTEEVEPDPGGAHPELGVLRASLAEGDWWACRPLPDAAAPNARTWLLGKAADVRDDGAAVERISVEHDR
ncbi:MAG TPA: hypothetical protein VN408_41895 [Actinoplanes sp.]|nr:hypothetical protein [Actinoplanes sp.]